jgi:hypothetical protein
MKRIVGWLIMLLIAFGPIGNIMAANEYGSKSLVTVDKKSNDQLIDRLKEIKKIAAKGNLTFDQKQDFKKEALDIKKQIQQNDPVLVISLSAALLVALILVLLARGGDDD